MDGAHVDAERMLEASAVRPRDQVAQAGAGLPAIVAATVTPARVRVWLRGAPGAPRG